MGETGQHDVIELLELIAQGRLDVRMVVAKQVDPPGADAVEVTPAFEVMQPYAFGFGDGHEGLGFVLFHLCAGVPHMAQAALDHGGIVHGPWGGS
ncbi:hypothetical protein D3C78_1665940 [compost metagenome]